MKFLFFLCVLCFITGCSSAKNDNQESDYGEILKSGIEESLPSYALGSPRLTIEDFIVFGGTIQPDSSRNRKILENIIQANQAFTKDYATLEFIESEQLLSKFQYDSLSSIPKESVMSDGFWSHLDKLYQTNYKGLLQFSAPYVNNDTAYFYMVWQFFPKGSGQASLVKCVKTDRWVKVDEEIFMQF
ncbi:hypothetical protein [Roseivirga pacifica]|uniref:hypothetical protein n=1 Tax=Roseivirga pacifica TaxID=1267423 RepID=UPI002094B499|nr:hypothetical protein [Roseivirga pacifica]MCO6359077.1 hypothetical protein [Roseivirga pacifica]MCO6365287.1 hypothetical protein [Roseivirga pacifica]MCO6371983.1 hypothetical protein [Roseivirga pacifica]MCO6375906.1 hypothetical protein [Roseivirga pacifica]MCO6379361.1 hypothetical protein [Roseivirga pacifica]